MYNSNEVLKKNEVKKLEKQIDLHFNDLVHLGNLIKEYNERIDELQNQIEKYSNEYDYDSDPEGNDFDYQNMCFLSNEIETNERWISKWKSDLEETKKQISDLKLDVIITECSIHKF